MKVWSNMTEVPSLLLEMCNKSKQIGQYVSIDLSRAHLVKNGRPFIGWSVIARVWNHAPMYTELVDTLTDSSKPFETEAEAVAFCIKTAQKFELKEDVGLRVRTALFGV
jgi:hypothetical protein